MSVYSRGFGDLWTLIDQNIQKIDAIVNHATNPKVNQEYKSDIRSYVDKALAKVEETARKTTEQDDDDQPMSADEIATDLYVDVLSKIIQARNNMRSMISLWNSQAKEGKSFTGKALKPMHIEALENVWEKFKALQDRYNKVVEEIKSHKDGAYYAHMGQPVQGSSDSLVKIGYALHVMTGWTPASSVDARIQKFDQLIERMSKDLENTTEYNMKDGASYATAVQNIIGSRWNDGFEILYNIIHHPDNG